MSEFAFVFPGQGSQAVGMLDAYPDAEGVVTATVEAASEALGYDLGEVIGNGPEEELNRTENTQPALLTAGVAAYALWQARGGPDPAYMAGHSLGEYTALVAAGSLDFREAVRLVADRARFMQEAVPAGQGKMAAILGLEDATVQQLCTNQHSGGVVRAANFNAPGQVVVAGDVEAVEGVLRGAQASGAKRTVDLPVSIPSHSPLMQPAAERLAERLAQVTIHATAIPVINNVDVAAPADPEAIADALVRQLASPVQWTQTIDRMRNSDVKQVVETGPGKVLCGLNKRIDRRMPCLSVGDAKSLDDALGAVQ